MNCNSGIHISDVLLYFGSDEYNDNSGSEPDGDITGESCKGLNQNSQCIFL